ncbi:hypothetical protein O9992_28365 [Vibrio lentus]|nr:hypothetical protein [Vibrio lentus]
MLRAIMIALGAQLLAEYHWVLYVFAAFLIGTGYQTGVRQVAKKRVLTHHLKSYFKIMPVTEDSMTVNG